PSGLQEAEMSMPRESVTRRRMPPSMGEVQMSVFSSLLEEKANRIPSGLNTAPVAKSPILTSGCTARVDRSTWKRCAPPPSRKLVNASDFPSGIHDGKRLIEPDVICCGPNPSESQTTIC